jgi:radical SAM-linked protein
MRLAIEFMRSGAARYASHLDMQRTAMRAVRRTSMNPEYSQGFNPHMLMSFASAMPVGLCSVSEYFELKLIDEMPPEVCLRELQAVMPEGFQPVWAGKLPDHAPKLMAALKAAGYELKMMKEQYPAVKKCIENSLESDMIEIEPTKKGKAKNIRPLMYSVAMDDTACTIDLLLAFSSEGSLNPEIFIQYIGGQIGEELEYELLRTGLYTVKDGSFVPLRQLCGE